MARELKHVLQKLERLIEKGGAMAGTQERLARVEAQLEQILLTGARTHAELREYVTQQRELLSQQSEKLGELERAQTETRAHLRWMKGIWAAAQAVVAGIVAWWK